MNYDIVIVGAGPAGSTLARLLDQKYKILLLDKRNFIDKHQKCCGGLLAPDAQKIMAQLGLALPKEVMVNPQMFSVKCEDLDNNMVRYYQRHYLNIDRKLFDKWLLSLMPNNVDIRLNALYKSCNRSQKSIEIKFRQDGKSVKVNSKILVAADGATSSIRNRIIAKHKQPDLYISLQNWYETTQKLPYFVSVFDESITDFYSWIIPKKGFAIVGTALKSHSNCQKNYNNLIEKLKNRGYIFNNCVKTEGTWIMRPRQLKQLNLYQNNIAFVGEAAGFISPSSAEGISYALKSAAILVKSLNKSLDNFGNIYQRNTAKLRLNILLKNNKLKLMYNKYTRKMIMKTGVLSMKLAEESKFDLLSSIS
ncbi:FAD-binding protein [Clostridium sp. 'deep sea']|uniref:FAD-binding protein n=1 Tax=Clostridium sp. 'deep sea' TaxID=2779445 RepID=UPI001896A38B|nr:FAD-binding protein [Clostridium sp. 'deep sea']QOR35256.1 FAD-binding protein [Clostridium sp. 'deep sea']